MSVIKGESLFLPQEAGPDVALFVYGDEFYARYETLDGYSVIYDHDKGLYCYATVVAGAFQSTGRPITKEPSVDLRRHLRESADVRSLITDGRMAQMRPREDTGGLALTFGPNRGLLTGRQVNTGAVKGLVILVTFDDEDTEITRDQVDSMLNDPDYNDLGNFCSVRKYYQLMSSGQLDYTNDVIGPIKLQGKKQQYIDQLLVGEALQAAVDDHGVNLADYDSRGSGIVDALSFIYAGRTVYQGDLWPHNSVFQLRQGATRTHYYTIQSLGRRPIDLSIGTFTHESGHMLCRFPDLYDYGSRDGDSRDSSGMGRYCLMSSGNHLGNGKVPAPICAFLRNLAGWFDNEVDLSESQIQNIQHGDYNTMFRFNTDNPTEFFLVENRLNIGLDRHLPDAGLAIYHCDTLGSNEWQGGTERKHYQCALIQADGRRDLELLPRTPGDTTDLFPLHGSEANGVVLSASTTPSSRQWDGSESGLVISDIRINDSAEAISFRSGGASTPDVPVTARQVNRSVLADMIIPDNNDDGVESEVTITEEGNVTRIELSVDITHTYRGDLEVDLVPPSGQPVRLHDRSGQGLDDLRLDINSDNDDSPLAALRGVGIDGNWALKVRDLAVADRGRLNRWSLDINYQPTVNDVVRAVSEPNLNIPDDSQTGVTDTITVEETGAIREVRVEIGVTHTYRGDLLVELISPSGEAVMLQDTSSDAASNLNAVYTAETVPALSRLVGASPTGEWQLRVRDLAEIDTGTLNRWSLHIHV